MHDCSPDLYSLLPALDVIYDFVTDWHRSISAVACRKGCSTCCTGQVTITETEAKRILTSFRPAFLYLQSIPTEPPAVQHFTTNEFARACLHGVYQKPPDFPDDPGCCPFLSASRECLIYYDRPLMCRLFISMSSCADNGEATVPEMIFLTNIILQQLTEHLSSGLLWGNLSSMLAYCTETPVGGVTPLRRCRKIPGFPFTPEEKNLLEHHLQPLFEKLNEGGWLQKGFSLDFSEKY